MLNNCGKSFCIFSKKIFHIDNKQIGPYNIVTSQNSVLNSNDLNKYLFADECESCRNRSRNSKHSSSNNNLGVYEPPIVIGSCESFQSIDSDDETDSDLEVDENVININKNKLDVSFL